MNPPTSAHLPFASKHDRRGILRGLMVAGGLPCLSGPVRAAAGEVGARGAVTRTIHGVTITDPFGWLDNAALDDPQVVRLMAEFADDTDRIMAPLDGLVEQLRAEADAATPPASPAAPVPDGDYSYWSQWAPGGRQLWRVHHASGERQLLLDAAELDAEGRPIGGFSAWGLSDDGATLAFATLNRPEHYDIRFKTIGTGKLLADVVRDAGVMITSEQLIWTADSRGIIYGEVDDTGRPWRARIHWLGQPQITGPVLLTETDPAFFVEIRQTTSRQFALINTTSTETSEFWLLDRSRLGEPRLVSQRKAGRTYMVDHGGGDAIDIITNDTHPNFRIVSAPLSAPDRWREVLPPDDRAGLRWHQAFRRHLAVSDRFEGASRVRLLDRASGQWRVVTFPDPISVAGFDRWTAGPEANREVDPDRLRLGVESFAAPKALYDYDLASGKLETLQKRPAASADFISERLYAKAPDGTMIPMSVFRPRGVSLRGALLNGYGAYGIPVDPDFDPQRFSLLTRGVAYINAHVRGGGDLGGSWHEAGKGERRGQPIEDFIACARALTDQGIVPAGRIVSMGRSAGGWLVGAALNRAPELWAGVMADVPFVDVLTQLLAPDQLLSSKEVSETGDVFTDPRAFALMLGLCPYQNIPAAKLPPVYITAHLADVRIPWPSVLKYVARLKAGHPDNAVALRLDKDGNHWGPADPATAERWREERVAFALRALGVH